MKHSDLTARYDALTDAIRVATDCIGDKNAQPQALAIIQALKRLRDDKPARVSSLNPVDYLEKAQTEARGKARFGAGNQPTQAIGGVDTPLGRLICTTWRTVWKGGKEAWRSEYTLAGNPITVREIRDAGLAQRPTTRNRQKKEARK